MNPHRPQRRSSFARRHGGEIVAGVVIAVLAAAIIGGTSGALQATWTRVSNIIDPPPVVEGIVGDWAFDRFEPGPPEPNTFGQTLELETIRIFADGTYIFSGAAVQTLNGERIVVPVDDSGTYTAVDGNSIKVQRSSGGLGAVDITVENGELRLFDPTERVTAVFARIGG